MGKINCLIIEDEPFARKGLAEYIEETEFLQLESSVDNIFTASDLLSKSKVDLIFLDISLPKASGLDLMKIRTDLPLVIITTAYQEYAVEGYSLNIVDYLLKPILQSRFLQAAHKAKSVLESKSASISVGSEPTFFFVKAEQRIERIDFDEVLFIKSLENYIVIQCKNRKLISYVTLKNVLEFLPSDYFVKVHRSFVVAISKIEKIEDDTIIIGKQIIPIGKSNKEDVLGQILKDRFLKR